MISGIAIEKGLNNRETLLIYSYCCFNKIPCKSFNNIKDIPIDYLPVGSVNFIESILTKSIVPDYFPEFLKDYIKRKVWVENNIPDKFPVFIKPADKYKRFNGFILNEKDNLEYDPPYICSEIIEFKNEWRYYVLNGKVLFSGWYMGDDTEPNAPELNIKFPPSFIGAVDFGETINNEFVLIESHHPYSCGFYGERKEIDLYLNWLNEGFNYIKKL